MILALKPAARPWCGGRFHRGYQFGHTDAEDDSDLKDQCKGLHPAQRQTIPKFTVIASLRAVLHRSNASWLAPPHWGTQRDTAVAASDTQHGHDDPNHTHL